MLELVGKQTESKSRIRGRRDLECKVTDCQGDNHWKSNKSNDDESADHMRGLLTCAQRSWRSV